ncbi:MAG: hypothetical protein WAQ27_02500 [Candidatus Microsaccharimonas sp.]
MMKILFLLLFPLFASAQIRPHVEHPQPAQIKYNWKGAIAPASMSFAAGIAGNGTQGQKFVRQGFIAGAALTIGFSSDARRPAWHYLADIGLSAGGFFLGQFVGETFIFTE